MSTAQQRGWGDPDAPGYRQNHIVGVSTGGVKVYVRREIAHLVQGFLHELVQGGYRLDKQADDWGYNNRDIRGRPGVKSNHAWGLAIDINSATNPMTQDGKVHTDMPLWVRESAHRWGFFWGADYSGSRKDPMHFEFLGTPADAHKFPTGRPAPEEDEDMTPDQDKRLREVEAKVNHFQDIFNTWEPWIQEIRDNLKKLAEK